MSKVVFIWLDGFSSRYLTPEMTPFLCEISQSGFFTTLEPMFAFAGIGATIFTGTGINRHKIWCDWVLDRDKPASHSFKMLLRLCNLLPNDILNQYARYAIYRIFRRNPGTPNLIPVEITDYFTTKEQRRLTDIEPIPGVITLFDWLRKHGVSYSLSNFYESLLERGVVRRILKALSRDNRLVLLRLASLDRLGHKYGPESSKITNRLGEIDDYIRAFVEKGIAADPSMHLVILSEHGMTPVNEYVDLTGILKKLPIKLGEDYMLFLNSTVACLWPSTSSTRTILIEELGKLKYGIVLDKTRLQELQMDEIGPEFGEILFALNEGVAFFPDFYRRRTPPRGMHGYAYSNYDRPVLIIHSPDNSYKTTNIAGARMVDVMPTILDLLSLPTPATSEGKSLLG
jgi:predicted AlkP superfamily pyrophosphatase or phosphodiesterase